jgi:hypothetical protein
MDIMYIKPKSLTIISAFALIVFHLPSELCLESALLVTWLCLNAVGGWLWLFDRPQAASNDSPATHSIKRFAL